jgi:hypothetical protein
METTAGSEPPPLRPVGDGTAVVAGHRGEVRLSRDRTRWWNGVMWEVTATSTPSDALRDADGRRWWDGAEWRPVTKVRPWYATPAVLMALHGVPFVLIVLGLAVGGVLLALGLLAYLVWAVVVLRSDLLGTRGKMLLVLLSVVGIALELLLRSRDARARDARVGASASRL